MIKGFRTLSEIKESLQKTNTIERYKSVLTEDIIKKIEEETKGDNHAN